MRFRAGSISKSRLRSKETSLSLALPQQAREKDPVMVLNGAA
jgi:hypothetical protein